MCVTRLWCADLKQRIQSPKSWETQDEAVHKEKATSRSVKKRKKTTVAQGARAVGIMRSGIGKGREEEEEQGKQQG